MHLNVNIFKHQTKCECIQINGSRWNLLSAQQNGLPTKNHEMYTSTEMNGFTVHVV